MIEQEIAEKLEQHMPALKALVKSLERSLAIHNAGTASMAIKSYTNLYNRIAELLPEDTFISESLALEITQDMDDQAQVGQVQFAANQLLNYLESLLEDQHKAARSGPAIAGEDFSFTTEDVGEWRDLGREIQDQVLRATRKTLRRAMRSIDIEVPEPPEPPEAPEPPDIRFPGKRKRGGRRRMRQIRVDFNTDGDEMDFDVSVENLSGQNLRETDFSEQDLSEKDFSGSNLSNSNFENANLSKTNFSGATLRESLMTGTNLQESNLSGANMASCNLADANCRQTNMTGVNLRDANLQSVTFDESNLLGANLRGTNLSSSSLNRVDAKGANLREANLGSANAEESDFQGVNLRDADLSHTQLSRINLSGANLRDANMENLVMREATLAGANLKGASIVNAVLTNSNFEGANLYDANLQGADCNGMNVDEAYLIDCVMPDGNAYEAGMDVTTFGMHGTPNDNRSSN